jgi:outer membrane protein assembly factor BamB
MSFRIRGFTGDVVPILEWRWSGDDATELASATPTGDISSMIQLGENELENSDLSPSYPQFLGPNRDGVVTGTSLEADWETHPPQLLWRRPVGAGWSGFAVSDRLAVTQEQNGDDETVVAYEFLTGKEAWRYSYPARYDSSLAGLGPRATPTIDSGMVFTTGATGILNSINLEDGKLIWTCDVIREHGSSNPPWGNSCSPLVLRDLVIVAAGGADGHSLVAYHRETGELLWSGGSDGLGYSSPQARQLAGVEQILILNKGSVAGHGASDGRVLWEFPWSDSQPNVAQPLPLPDDRVLVSSGYGIGSKLLRIQQTPGGKFTVEQIWETPRMKAKFTNLVYHEGFVYGLDDGILTCLDPSDGSAKWKRGRYGHGQVILVNDLLLLQSEHGEIVLIDPNPEELTELARLEVFDHKSWNPPALVGNYLLVRTDLEAACYRLPTVFP